MKYINDLLATINMTEALVVSTPMFITCKLSKYGDYKILEPFLYRSTISVLQYVTLTRPDITFCVNKACQYMAEPLKSHWNVVKRMLRYLSGATHMKCC